ncbi:MAG: Fe-S-containing protein [Treponema sp.]|nr:Fe-S-containing protein [Treponema sp.]
MQYLLTTGILAALVFARGGEDRGKKRALAGCLAGAGAALILSILLRTTNLIHRGFFTAWTLVFAVLFGILYILSQWNLLKPKFLKKIPALEKAFPDVIAALLLGVLLLYALPTIFLYPAEFVLAGQSVISTDFLFKLIGYLAGLTVVAVASVALYKTGGALSPSLVKIVLTAALLINIGNQLIAIVQFLLARRIIPMIRWLFRLIIVAVNYNVVFLYSLMALALLPPVVLFINSLRSRYTWKNPAEHRKLRAARRINRRWCFTVALGFGVSVFSLTFIKASLERGVELSPAEPMTIAGAEILIPIERIEDGHLHRFNYTAADAIEMRFIVIKKNAAAYGVGLDACDICGPTGYYERKDEVICKLCDVVMNISTIGFRGGCNPVPLAYTLRGGNMVIDTEDLEKERNRFK